MSTKWAGKHRRTSCSEYVNERRYRRGHCLSGNRIAVCPARQKSAFRVPEAPQDLACKRSSCRAGPGPLILEALEQRQLVAWGTAQRVIVQHHAADTSIFGQRASLRCDHLSCQDAAHWRQERIPVQQLQVAGKLLNRVDRGASLDLHGPV